MSDDNDIAALRAEVERHRSGEVFTEMIAVIEQQRSELGMLRRQSHVHHPVEGHVNQQRLMDDLDDALFRVRGLEGEVESHRQARIIEKVEALGYMDEVSRLRDERAQLVTRHEREKSALTSETNTVRARLAAMEAEYRRVLEEVEGHHCSGAESDNQGDAKAELAELHHIHDSLVADHLEMERAQNSTLTQLKELEVRFNALNTELVQVSKAYETSLAVYADFERTSDNSMKSMVKSLDAARTDIQAKSARLGKLESQLQGAKSELAEAKNELASLSESLEASREKESTLETTLVRAESDLSNAKLMQVALESKIASLQTQIADLTLLLSNTRQSTGTTIQSLQTQLDRSNQTLQETVTSMKSSHMAQMQTLQTSKQSLQTELAAQIRRYEEGVRKIFEATLLGGREAPPAYQQESEAHTKITQLSDTVTQLTLQTHEQSVRFMNEVEQLTQAHAKELELAEIKQVELVQLCGEERDQYQAHISGLNQELKAVESARALLESDHAVLKAGSTVLQEKLEVAMTDLDKLQSEHARVMRQLSLAEANALAMKLDMNAISVTSSELETIKQEKRTLEAAVEVERSKMAQMEAQARQQLQETYRAYTIEATRAYEMQSMISQLQQQVAQLSKQANASGGQGVGSAEAERLKSEVALLRGLLQQHQQSTSSDSRNDRVERSGRKKTLFGSK